MSDGFVTAVGPNGQKRRVPEHYLDNPAFGFRLPASAKDQRTDDEGAAVAPIGEKVKTIQVKEPAKPDNKKEASE